VTSFHYDVFIRCDLFHSLAMILWIDPGIRKLGYALIKENMEVVDAGVLLIEFVPWKKGMDLTIPKITRDVYRDRMGQIFQFFEKMLERYPWEIDVVCVEKLYFMEKNQSNAEFVYGIRGALMMLFFQHHILLLELTPIQLKKYVCGNAKASKDLMIMVVQKLFWLDGIAYHDIADALGLAYLALKMWHKKL